MNDVFGTQIVFGLLFARQDSEEVFVSQERVSSFSEKGADLWGSPGNFRGSLENFRGSLGNFRGTFGLLLSSTVRELLGKSPGNLRVSSGNFRGSPGTSQKILCPQDTQARPCFTPHPQSCVYQAEPQFDDQFESEARWLRHLHFHRRKGLLEDACPS